jgi:hypothetical protein
MIIVRHQLPPRGSGDAQSARARLATDEMYLMLRFWMVRAAGVLLVLRRRPAELHLGSRRRGLVFTSSFWLAGRVDVFWGDA